MEKHSFDIKLEALQKVCNGDSNKEHKYLKKFLEMMPLSITGISS